HLAIARRCDGARHTRPKSSTSTAMLLRHALAVCLAIAGCTPADKPDDTTSDAGTDAAADAFDDGTVAVSHTREGRGPWNPPPARPRAARVAEPVPRACGQRRCERGEPRHQRDARRGRQLRLAALARSGAPHGVRAHAVRDRRSARALRPRRSALRRLLLSVP